MPCTVRYGDSECRGSMGHTGQRGGIGMVAASVHVATAPVAVMVAMEPAPVETVVTVQVITGMMALAAAEALVAQVVLLRVVVLASEGCMCVASTTTPTADLHHPGTAVSVGESKWRGGKWLRALKVEGGSSGRTTKFAA